MSLSTLNLQFLLETYKKYLQSHPLLTKSITSGVLGFAGSAVAAKLRVSLFILKNFYSYLLTYLLMYLVP